MIEFAHPILFLLLLLPVVIYLAVPEYKERRHSIQVPYFNRLVDLSGVKPQSGAVVRKRKRIQRALLGFGWLCLVLAMAKPEWVGEPVERKRSAREIMVAVDLSGSMSEEDFVSAGGESINRLEAVKEVLSEFASTREHDRLGLILFADAAYLQAPLTDNTDTWLALLESSQLSMAGWLTAIGDAIGLAISVFENAQTDNRILILLTDGTDTGSRMPPVQAAEVAADYGIRIYTIAMGSPETRGRVKLDLESLQTIADITQGSHFLAMNREDLARIYQTINALEENTYDTLSYRPRTSLHHYPFAAFMLLFVVIQITHRLLPGIRSAPATKPAQLAAETSGKTGQHD